MRSGFEESFSLQDLHQLQRAIGLSLMYENAKQRIVHRLRTPLVPVHDYAPEHQGLTRLVPGTREKPRVPFGWVLRAEWTHDAYRLIPVWVYPFWWLRLYGSGLYYIPLIRLGFMQGPEGGLVADFHWNWRIWESQYYRHWLRTQPGPWKHKSIWRWWWLVDRFVVPMVRDFKARMPR